MCRTSIPCICICIGVCSVGYGCWTSAALHGSPLEWKSGVPPSPLVQEMPLMSGLYWYGICVDSGPGPSDALRSQGFGFELHN